MHPYATPPRTEPSRRPTVSEVRKDESGASSFTITFLAGQELPTHRNASRILINVLQGNGAIMVDAEQPSPLVTGTVVQIGPNIPHALVAGEIGLLVEVHLVADCCASC